MRVTHLLLLGSATALLTVPGVAHAKVKSKPAPTTDAAPTESAAARAARLAASDDTGALRGNELHGVAVETTVTATPDAAERGPATNAVAAPVRNDQPLSGALSELVDKRMAQNGAFTGLLDGCMNAAKTRNPRLSGVVSIAVHVVGKNASVEVSTMGSADPQLVSCLSAVHGKLSLPDLSFPWQLQLSSTNGGEMATR
jgi:hypothetical protein